MTIEQDTNEAGVEVAAGSADVIAAPMARPMPMPRGPAVVLAPFRYLFQPRMCGWVMASSPIWSGCAFLLGLLLIGASVLLGIVIDQKVEYDWMYMGGGQANLVERGFLEAWQSLGDDVISAPVASLMIMGMSAFWCLLATVLLTWFNLPIVHRSRSAGRSFGRAFWAVTAGVVGPGSVIVLAMSLMISMVGNYRDELISTNQFGPMNSLIGYAFIGLIVSAWLGIALLGRWTRVAAMGARSAEPLPRTAITCEACGYDLTHLSDAGRCTECGVETRISLDSSAQRVGISWERDPSFATWNAANWLLVTNPRLFYKRLHMRSQEARGFTFALFNYVALGVSSVVSITGIVFVTQPSVDMEELIAIIAIGGVISAVGVWLLHALMGAIAATLTLFRKQTRPFAYISKVWQYESGYLWILWGLGHALAWSFALANDWMTTGLEALTGIQFFAAEGLIVPIVALVFLAGWLFRFMRAIRIVHWANF